MFWKPSDWRHRIWAKPWTLWHSFRTKERTLQDCPSVFLVTPLSVRESLQRVRTTAERLVGRGHHPSDDWRAKQAVPTDCEGGWREISPPPSHSQQEPQLVQSTHHWVKPDTKSIPSHYSTLLFPEHWAAAAEGIMGNDFWELKFIPGFEFNVTGSSIESF